MNIDLVKDYRDELVMIPLGGADEIGINMYLYQYLGKWLIVDMGLGFADANYPGVDLMLPDISVLDSIRDDILAIIVTHAHEDHMGAIPYLWDEIGVPIYATAFASKIIKSKLIDQGLADKVDMREIAIGGKMDLGPFHLEFVPLTHSIVQMQAIVIETPLGKVFHSGDWKFDPDPVCDVQCSKERLKEIGQSGVLAMVCDSTNIFNDGTSGSEGQLRSSLCDIVGGYKNKLVVVTTFASNIARMDSLMYAAKKAGRKLVLSGTSLWRMYEAAVETGYLLDYERPLHPKVFKKHKRKDLLVLATGCQGEELATMNKLANNNHQDIYLKEDDVVIFSSKIIPGNESKIHAIFGKLYQLGVRLLTERDHFVHVSGHNCKDELQEMYKLIKPKFAIPMHGQPMHTHEHCDFVRRKKLAKPVQISNGSVVVMSSTDVEVIGKIKTGYMLVDGDFIIPSDSSIINERRQMVAAGLVVVTVAKDGVRILAPGSLDLTEDAELLSELKIRLQDYIPSSASGAHAKDLEFNIKTAVKRFFKSEVGKNPLIMIQIIKD